MKKLILCSIMITSIALYSNGQKTPSGNPADFKVKTALHSVSYSGNWGQATLTVDEFLVKAKELGFDGVMLGAKRPHVSPMDYDDAARKKLRARIKELGLELVCMKGYMDFTSGADIKGNVPNSEIQAIYIGELARLARDLGTNMVRVYVGYERPNIPFADQYALVVKGLQMAGEIAAKYNITLIVLNHINNVVVHHDDMKMLLDDVNLPNVKSAFDCWSPTVLGASSEDLKTAIHTMSPYLVHTTTATNFEELLRYEKEGKNSTNEAEGKYEAKISLDFKRHQDLKTFVNTLKEIGYQGYIGFEMCGPIEGGGSVENLDKAAKNFLEWVKQFK